MSETIRALAAFESKGELKPFEYTPGPLGDEQVEITVENCGICHSDLSMQNNDWGMTAYPFVPGHEVVGRVAALGSRTKRLKVGDRVGLGWFAASCGACTQCLSGSQNLCATAEQRPNTPRLSTSNSLFITNSDLEIILVNKC